ncbi:hypothetical protein [Flavobacterium sp.]|uniref:hypothetical protein n=1 Tax=Flavobacterium sp. TaxID=239 RepID=UPI0032646C0C
MILGFSTQINGKPTYFPEKILGGLLLEAERSNNIVFHAHITKYIRESTEFKKTDYHSIIEIVEGLEVFKYHTIREDKTDRWKAGMKIDFFINVRKKNMFRFAPVLPVVSTQKIKIKHGMDYISIWIDDCLYEVEHNGFYENYKYEDLILELAQNDGFDTVEDYFKYFNKDFKGKIIHWTDKRY